MFVFIALALAMLLACAFVLFRAQGQRPTANDADDSPEWAVLRAKRDEIENDPSLSDEAREDARREWAAQADATLSRLSTQSQGQTAPRFTPWLLAALTLGVGAYALIGHWSSEALQSYAATPGLGGQDQVPPREDAKHPGDNQLLDERIAALKAKLAARPDDIDGWVLLARSYGTQRKFKEGSQALEKALALSPGHPDLLADLADMLAMTQGKTLAGRPLTLIEEALRAAPDHRKALALAATAAMERNDTAGSLGFWRRLRATYPPEAPDVARIDDTIAQLGGAPSAPSKATGSARISGSVVASPALIARLKATALPPGAMLFITAKASGGTPMPVAVLRTDPQALINKGSFDFTLDDSLAMSPQMTLSGQKSVDIEARISMSGTAARGANDVSEKLTAVAVGSEGLRLTLP